MLGRDWASVCEGAAPFLREASATIPDVVCHVRGVAKGCGLDAAELFAVNARSELMALARVATAECTVIGRPGVLAQNWDWFTRQRDGCSIVRTDRFVTFTEAGMPAKVGLNRDGLAITLNFMITTPPPDRAAPPIHLLIAHVLESCRSVGDAASLLLRTPVACSATIGLADDGGDIAFIELTPHRRGAIDLAAVPPVHTNHCLGGALAGADLPGPLLASSMARLRRARCLLEDGVPVESILADTADPRSALDIAAPAGALAIGTVASIVMDLRRRALVVAPGRPSEAGFVQSVGLDG